MIGSLCMVNLILTKLRAKLSCVAQRSQHVSKLSKIVDEFNDLVNAAIKPKSRQTDWNIFIFYVDEPICYHIFSI